MDGSFVKFKKLEGLLYLSGFFLWAGEGGYCLSMIKEVIFCNLEDFCFFLVFFVAKNEKITQIIYKLFIF